MKRNAVTLQDVAALPQIGNAEACSETTVPQALQQFARFKDRLSGRVDMRIRTLDAPAHLEDLDEAVVQDIVDVVGQTLNRRAAHIFDTLSTMGNLQPHDATPSQNPARETLLRGWPSSHAG